jgi:hypothetical protein
MFFRRTDIAKTIALASTLFLFGCSHAVKKPAPRAATEAMTGIPACDSYLDSYVACHRAAGIYPPETLSAHYQVMRDTLLQESSDPHVRPYLANRCQSLSQQLRDTLQSRSCSPAAVTPAAH